MEKINVPGVPSVSNLKTEGKGMEIIRLLQKLSDLTDDQGKQCFALRLQRLSAKVSRKEQQ
jgi:hypothetical protein